MADPKGINVPADATPPPAAAADVPPPTPKPVSDECPKHLGRRLDPVIEVKTCNLDFEHPIVVARRCAVCGDTYDLDGNPTAKPEKSAKAPTPVTDASPSTKKFTSKDKEK